MAHLTEPSPDSKDFGFAAWKVEDSLIMSWLWSSIQPETSRNCMFLSIAKEIWDTVKHIYSKVQDASVVFDIKMKISSPK